MIITAPAATVLAFGLPGFHPWHLLFVFGSVTAACTITVRHPVKSNSAPLTVLFVTTIAAHSGLAPATAGGTSPVTPGTPAGE